MLSPMVVGLNTDYGNKPDELGQENLESVIP